VTLERGFKSIGFNIQYEHVAYDKISVRDIIVNNLIGCEDLSEIMFEHVQMHGTSKQYILNSLGKCVHRKKKKLSR